jgi:AcrR family transcriptional regulator
MRKRAAKRRTKPAVANGKRRLIDAALRLSARGAALSSLGLRELAREADLNHNTFYRHFRDIDELGQAAAEEVSAQIMSGMKEVRSSAATHADATQGAAEYFLDFVEQNPDAFIVGLREAHSASTPMRRIMRRVLEEIAAESVDQIVTMNLAPGLDRGTLLRATSTITYYMLYRSLDYIEHPEQREAIIEQIVTFVRMQFLGAAALRESAFKRE